MRLDHGGCGDHRTMLSKIGRSLRHDDDVSGLGELERAFWPEELPCSDDEELDFELDRI